MIAYFLSDIHLKSVNERSGRDLLRFLTSMLQSRNEEETHLFLLGDIFDLWLSDHEVFVRKFLPVIEPIRDLRTQGVKIYFFEGNHDLHIHPYWESQLGVKVYTSAAMFKLGPWKVRCEHGDEINQEDKAYLRLRATLRNSYVEKVGHALPGVFWDKLGGFLSHQSRQYSSGYRIEKEKSLVEMIRSHAERVYDDDPFDFIVSGHMHVRDDYEFQRNEKKARSINLGSWFDEPKIFKLTDQGAEWIDP